MFLSFKHRKYSTVQKWHVSRGFLENPYRPVTSDLSEPVSAPGGLRSRIETSSVPTSKDLKELQTAPLRDLAGSLKTSHELMGKGRIK